MLGEIYSNIAYFFNLTLTTQVLWVALPLAIATVVMLFYFEKYRDEMPGWNTHVSNSLVLLFVSMTMFRHLFNLDNAGAINFVYFPGKFFVSLFVLILGIIILFLNFEHFMPEKLARYVSSPLTLNLFAYTLLVFVYSEKEFSLNIIFSLILIFVFLLAVLNVIRVPLKDLFLYMKRVKDEENIKVLVDQEKKIEKEKKEIKKKEKQVKNLQNKVLKKEKQRAKKIKRMIRKK